MQIAIYLNKYGHLCLTCNGMQSYIQDSQNIAAILADSDISADDHKDLYSGWSCIVNLLDEYIDALQWNQSI